MRSGTIFDIKEMAVHDGPGIRTTVFFKGCPLRCTWCHNPEGLSSEPQLMAREKTCVHCGACRQPCEHELCRPFGRCILRCPNGCLEVAGKRYTSQELANRLKTYRESMGDAFGGITFSGGEPLFQPQFLLEVMEQLAGEHLCIQTSGFASPEVFSKVLERLDFVIMDVKLADPAMHKRYTGCDNAPILANLRTLQQSGKPHLLRTPLIPNITDTQENLRAVEKLVGSSDWEKLPYNTLAGAKYNMPGMEFSLEPKD